MKSLELVTADDPAVLAHVDFPTAPLSLVTAPGGELALGMSVFACGSVRASRLTARWD